MKILVHNFLNILQDFWGEEKLWGGGKSLGVSLVCNMYELEVAQICIRKLEKEIYNIIYKIMKIIKNLRM